MKPNSFSKLLFISLIASAGTASASSSNVKSVSVVGTVPTYVSIHETTKNPLHALASKKVFLKPIVLEKIELSADAKKYLASQVDKPNKTLLAADLSVPPQASIDMTKMPVLDQGRHGTCVTFAVTGAINSVYEKPNYISQLCNLELGYFLEQNISAENPRVIAGRNYDRFYSGWDGSLNEIVLNQIQEFGYVTTAHQKASGCANPEVTEYPLTADTDADKIITTTAMSEQAFKRVGKSITNEIYVKPIFSEMDAFTPQANKKKIFLSIKKAISSGHRVVFGTLLDVNGKILGRVNGATGKYHVANDSWIVTAKVKADARKGNIKTGHAMIIAGYDDNAEIIGARGEKHKGVFTLRNSWSEGAGDNGNYYMSYEYFNLLSMEVMEISPTPIN